MDSERSWWEALFQIHEYATYPEVAATLTRNEVDFLETVLMLRPEQRILDLGCGNGRHLLELARRGYRADGVELADPVVAHLQAQIAEEESTARIFHHDMRHVDGLGRYDVILIMNSSFGFWSDEEHLAMLESIEAALDSGGRLVLQCINPYQIGAYMQQYRRGWHAVGPGYVLRASQFNPQLGCIETAYRYIEPEGGEVVHPGERIRLYTYPELTKMLRQAHLQPVSLFGDATLPVVTFDESSQWQVIVAQKAR